VESGSPEILKRIDKKITPEEILASTRMAQKYGIKVRYYMMLGNRGETRATFQETLRFLDTARPHEYIFSCLSIYPGTRDFDEAEKTWLDRNVYFKEKFQELKTPFDASDADTAFMNEWFRDHSGLRTVYRETPDDYRAIVAALGEDHHAARMDLGVALYDEGDLDGAEREVRRALDLGYPCPGLAYNHLACIAKRRGDLDAMMDHFTQASKVDPQHYVLIQNVNRARAWFKDGGPDKKLPLELVARHDFQLLERTIQPTLPGPLPDDFDVWTTPDKPEASPDYVKTPDLEGSKKELRTRLKVI
jgi:anaerobic magnesium-protoporphyrin IX monomethyl ester cyclase